MIITIVCECGNKVSIPILSKKYAQLKDYLDSNMFHYDGEKLDNGELKELRIRCNKCKNWIVLGVN